FDLVCSSRAYLMEEFRSMRVSIWLAFLVMLLAVTAHSQSPSNRSSVTGLVRDQAGAAIVGARVVLGAGGVEQQSTTTDQSGNFQFKRVPAGKYQIQVTSQGFESTTIDVALGPKPLAPLQVVMAIASLRQETTITSEPSQISTQASDNQDSIALGEQSLSNLPVFDQDYIAALSRFLDPGSIGTSGVSLVVDGMEVNNLGVSSSAIKEIKINKDPYSVEFQRPGRGRIEVTTKPGSTDYHGTFNFIFRDAHLNARDPFALVRPPEQRRIFEGYLSGPVGHSKKTSFLVSVSRKEEDVQSVVYAQEPTGIIQENVPAPARTLLVAAQIGHALSDTNTFSVRYSYLGDSVMNQGVGGTVLPEAGFTTKNTEQEINYSQQTVFSAKLVNSFRILVGYERHSSTSMTQRPGIVVLDAFTGGGAQADQLRTEYHMQLTDTLSYSTGMHLIKAGVNIPDLSRRGLDNNTNAGGTFYFSSLADYVRRLPYSFVQQQGNGHAIFLEKLIAPFVQDEYHIRKNLMISAGLRYDWQNYFRDNDNFAPRFSFAYAPGNSKTTVIRGGAGLFYDRTGSRTFQDVQLFDGARLRLFVLPNPGYPNPLSSGQSFAAQPVSVTRFAAGVDTPYNIQYSVEMEQQTWKSTTLAITYLGYRGVDQFRSVDVNTPLPPNYTTSPDPQIGVLR
ncbi:MAG: TonB-dependent receptor domain-containing protein, partial [Blastocatellia bacterium]